MSEKFFYQTTMKYNSDEDLQDSPKNSIENFSDKEKFILKLAEKAFQESLNNYEDVKKNIDRFFLFFTIIISANTYLFFYHKLELNGVLDITLFYSLLSTFISSFSGLWLTLSSMKFSGLKGTMNSIDIFNDYLTYENEELINALIATFSQDSKDNDTKVANLAMRLSKIIVIGKISITTLIVSVFCSVLKNII